MLTTKFGVEIEMTGLTREKASQVVAEYLDGRVSRACDGYDTYMVTAPDGRVWKLMSDASIKTQRKVNGILQNANDKAYSVEFVTPILTYAEDIETLQELVRLLRRAGAVANESTGIHVHLDGVAHTVRSIRNFVNIIASKNDLFYKALRIKPERMAFCKKLDKILVDKLNARKPTTMEQLADIWYEGYYDSRFAHYNQSRYHFINLHSFFSGHHTVELRGFNSTLHAGVVRSYVVLALAINHQALTQKCASSRPVQAENEKFAMRTYLNRIGLIGDDFANCREHLCKSLPGCSAWRYRIA
jgi:hypothetical protein